jgi:hypothetical protein
MTEQEYRKLPAINQSTLKQYEHHYVPRESTDENKMYADYEPEYTVVGNIVDAQLTGGDPNEKYVRVRKEPSAVVKSIVTYLKNNNLSLEPENVLTAPDEPEFDKRIKDVTKRTTAIIEQGAEFYDALSSGKIPVAEDLWTLADTIVFNMQTKESTGQFFRNNKGHFYQAIVVGNLQVGDLFLENCKCMIDILDVQNGRVTVIDVKTTGESTLSFPRKIERYGYDFQLDFYNMMVDQNILRNYWNIEQPDPRMEALRQNHNSLRMNMCSYLLVESTQSPGYPLAYRLNHEYLGKLAYRMQKAIENYHYAKQHPNEVYTKSFIDNGHIVEYEPQS